MQSDKSASDPQAKPSLRQQFDDLDELMQRMLALSVDPTEDKEGKESKPAPLVFAPVQQRKHYPEFDWSSAQSQSEAGAEPGAAKEKTDEPRLPTFVPIDAPAGEVDSVAPSSGSSAATIHREAWAEDASPGIEYSLWLMPFVLVNRVYEGCTCLFGPLGRPLRSGLAKNLLGICGLAGVVGSVAWIVWERADWNW